MRYLPQIIPWRICKYHVFNYPPWNVESDYIVDHNFSNGPPALQSWIDTYGAVKFLIPVTPPSTLVNGQIVYPVGVDVSSRGTCSWTNSHCFGPDDIHTAPAGYMGLAFDVRSPWHSHFVFQAYVTTLIRMALLALRQFYTVSDSVSNMGLLCRCLHWIHLRFTDFLSQHNLSATLFMIGSNILSYDPAIFQQALLSGQNIGCVSVILISKPSIAKCWQRLQIAYLESSSRGSFLWSRSPPRPPSEG